MQGMEIAGKLTHACDMPGVVPASKSEQLALQIASMEIRLAELRRAKELLDKHPDIEELVSLLQRI